MPPFETQSESPKTTTRARFFASPWAGAGADSAAATRHTGPFTSLSSFAGRPVFWSSRMSVSPQPSADVSTSVVAFHPGTGAFATLTERASGNTTGIPVRSLVTGWAR